MASLEEPERAIAEKIKTFQELIANAEWEKVVRSCYAPSATLSHFMAPEALTGRDSILEFFNKTSEGYSLDLAYTITQLGSSSAWLVAGVGSVDKGPWCCFAERWKSIDGDWLMTNDKVYAPEVWMKQDCADSDFF